LEILTKSTMAMYILSNFDNLSVFEISKANKKRLLKYLFCPKIVVLKNQATSVFTNYNRLH